MISRTEARQDLPSPSRPAIAVGLLLLLLPWTLAADPGGATPERAVALYDEERYAEAREILEKLDADGRLTGPLIYRLSFCLRAAGDRDGETRLLERAVTALEQEVRDAESFEPAFYLVNAYRNLDRREEARGAAARATAPVDSGERKPADDPLEWFRLGKLYADQRREDQAVRWFGKAAERLDDDATFPAYLRWARRYLGDLAFAKAHFAEAETHYASLAESGLASGQDYDRLAVARTRVENWKGAEEAWKQSEKADSADVNRARYCQRLAAMAASIGSLPPRSPVGPEGAFASVEPGPPWSSLGKEHLEALMKDLAGRVKALQAESKGVGVTPDTLESLQHRIDEIRPSFVAAALEYAVRNYPIRATAFFGGYAPLIFQPDAWTIVTEEKKRRPGRQRSKAVQKK